MHPLLLSYSFTPFTVYPFHPYMINITTKIHDQFSIEFKVGFAGSEKDMESNFKVNSWIFIPNSLGINASTYSKEQFYRDVKSNIRLITPNYALSELVDGADSPLAHVRQALEQYRKQPASIHDLEFQVKMFCAIFKSALRDASNGILKSAPADIPVSAPADITDNVSRITRSYRQLIQEYDGNEFVPTVFLHGDEYMSHLIGIQAARLLRFMDTHPEHDFGNARQKLQQLIHQETAYKEGMGYSHITSHDEKANQDLVYKHGLLKKYIESALYLKKDTTNDGAAMKEITFSIAAGFAMLVSTLIAWPFQKYLGSYPFLIFIILIVAYMFKDRIKDFARNLFVHRLKSKYFDHKTTIHFKEEEIGWVKEGMDFINDAKTPDRVLAIRNRSDLEADNTLQQERTILYRKQVSINTQNLRNHYEYQFAGINDIMRFHIQQYTQKMDDPTLPVDLLTEDGTLRSVPTLRVYIIHIVLQFSHNEETEYRGFRITATRDGIVTCEEMK